MKKNSFIPLPPFKGWVLQNFPFIEEDFDAITSYQLWCKVVEYLKEIAKSQNNVIENNNELNNKFIELVEYVNNYLDNIDITEDVNNKLDEMAIDGTLERIINEEIFTDLNNRTKDLKVYAPSLLNSVGSEMCTLIKTDNKAVLFDTGRATSVPYTKQYLEEKLGEQKIDAVIISHYHGDHMGGLEGLADLYSDNVIVYLPMNFIPYFNGTENIQATIDQRTQVLNFLNTNNISYIEVDTDRTIDFEDFTVDLTNSTDEAYSYYNSIEAPTYNSYSMNALVRFGASKILFPGDSKVDTQDYLMSKNQVEKVNLLCSFHHGYERFKNTKYMKILNPDYEYYSVAPVSWDSINLLQYDYAYPDNPKITTQAYNDVEYSVSNYGTIETKANFVRNDSMFFNKIYEVYVNSNFSGVPDGSENAPYKSIAQVLDDFPQTGCDITIHLANGTYDNIRFKNINNTLTIIADNPGQVLFGNTYILNCSDLVLNSIKFTEGINNCVASNVYFNRCVFNCPASTAGNVACTLQRSHCYFNACDFATCYTGLYASTNNFVTMLECTFECTQYAIYSLHSYIGMQNYTLTSGILRQDSGSCIRTILVGSTANRPLFNNSNNMRGYLYFDTQLGKPIFYYNSNNADGWIDASGNNV